MASSSSSSQAPASSSSQPVASSSSQRTPPASISIPVAASLLHHLPLYQAILSGDLTKIERCMREDAPEIRITSNSDTALHVAVGTGTTKHSLQYLFDRMSDDQVLLRNNDGNNVLSAAIVGNVEAAKVIMNRKLQLIDVENSDGNVPLIEAARHGHKTMVEYLLPFSESYLLSEDRNSKNTRVFFVHYLIIA